MKSKRWKTQYIELPNQSDFHQEARLLFCTDEMFCYMKCYQEVATVDLIPGYPYTNHHFDWYIKELNLIIELHGQQHYKPTSFGQQGYVDKQISFRRQRFRDNSKATAAIDAGFTYIAIPYKYKNKLSKELILKYAREANDNRN